MERAVAAAEGDQLGVGAALDDPAVVEEEDAVGVHQRAETVRDDDGDAAGALGAERADALLGAGVDGGGRVVEDHDGGLQHQRPRDGEALALAAGEGDAALADHGAVLGGEAQDVVVELGGGAGALDATLRIIDDAGPVLQLLDNATDTELARATLSSGGPFDVDIQGGALEESNVDLSEELVKMIVAQRNFQANAQVIQTADQVTQSIINIR